MQKIKKVLPLVDELYKAYTAKIHSPGFVYSIIVDGELIGARQTGFTQTKERAAVTQGSVFRVASMSKSFTATAILQLRDADKLKLDDPVSMYIPAFAKAAYRATDAAPVTIRKLDSHSAGFPVDNPWGDRQLAKTNKDLQVPTFVAHY